MSPLVIFNRKKEQGLTLTRDFINRTEKNYYRVQFKGKTLKFRPTVETIFYLVYQNLKKKHKKSQSVKIIHEKEHSTLPFTTMQAILNQLWDDIAWKRWNILWKESSTQLSLVLPLIKHIMSNRFVFVFLMAEKEDVTIA